MADAAEESGGKALELIASPLGGLVIALVGASIWSCDDGTSQFGLELPYGYVPRFGPVEFGSGIGCTRPLFFALQSQAAPWVVGLIAALIIYVAVRLWGRFVRGGRAATP